jgi:hypothetical protein
MTRMIEFVCEEEDVRAQAVLWEDRAPRTCQAVWQMLPVTAYIHHAIYSGSEVAMILPQVILVGSENATSVVQTGEIGFLTMYAADYFEVTKDFSELCFFYGRGACPSMMEGPVKVNLFAHFVAGEEALYALCHRMRREGQKSFTVRRLEE